MELTILGSSSMVPTKERNVSGYFLSFEKEGINEGILLDCGEGTQRQMNIAGIKRTAVTRILLTHWHGDHVSGVIGLLQTLGNENPSAKIHIHGPLETRKRMQRMLETCIFETKIEIEVYEHHPKDVETIFENQTFKILCASMSHSVPCIGYSVHIKDTLHIDTEKVKKLKLKDGHWMKEVIAGKSVKLENKTIKPEQVIMIKKGKKIAYIPDTTPNKNVTLLGDNADILLIESTYAADLRHKAEEYCHLTAQDAAQLAVQANAKKLLLTHFSQRYKQTTQILEDAQLIFPNTECVYDFMRIKI